MVLFAIVYRAGPSWKPGRPMREQGLEAHGAYMKRLFDKKRTFAAGPFGPEGGLVILHARNIAEAEALLAADPAIEAGIFVGEVKRFPPRFLRDGPLVDKRDGAAS